MQGLPPSPNLFSTGAELRMPSPSSFQQTAQQTNPTMNDLAARIEQQKLLLRRAQLSAAAEQQPPPAFGYSASGNGIIKNANGNNGGLDAVLRHKALLMSAAQPTANSTSGLPTTTAALDGIDVKNGLYSQLGGGGGRLQQQLQLQLQQQQQQGLLQLQRHRQNNVVTSMMSQAITLDCLNDDAAAPAEQQQHALLQRHHQRNNAFAVNHQAAALGLNANALGASLNTNPASSSPSPANLGMFRNARADAFGAAAANGNSLFAAQRQNLALQRMQQNALPEEESRAKEATSQPPQLVVPASLAHLQPQPLKKKKKKAARKKKPAGKPKRPLSAYNLFFRDERGRILESIPTPAGYGKKKKRSKKTTEGEEGRQQRQDGADVTKRREAPHGKIGFENLAKIIGKRWQELSEEEAAPYKASAEKEMAAYRKKMEEWAAKREGEAATGDGDGVGGGGKRESDGDKKRKSLDERADEILFASVQKKVKQIHDEHRDGGLPFPAAPTSCF